VFGAILPALTFDEFEFVLPVAGAFTLVLTGAGVLVLTGAGVARLVLTFALFVLAASPQAIPSAPKPRTVVSAITFFILSIDSYLSQRFIFSLLVASTDRTQSFCPELFLFGANVNIVFEITLVNLKMIKK
jgi:hypothetical protein